VARTWTTKRMRSRIPNVTRKSKKRIVAAIINSPGTGGWVSTVALLGVFAAAQSAQSSQKSKEGSVNERPANRAAATFFVAAHCEVANWLWWTVESGQRKKEKYCSTWMRRITFHSLPSQRYKDVARKYSRGAAPGIACRLVLRVHWPPPE
jgi:hypothetical protein